MDARVLYLGNGKEVLYFNDGHKEYRDTEQVISINDWLTKNKRPTYLQKRDRHLYSNVVNEE